MPESNLKPHAQAFSRSNVITHINISRALIYIYNIQMILIIADTLVSAQFSEIEPRTFLNVKLLQYLVFPQPLRRGISLYLSLGAFSVYILKNYNCRANKYKMKLTSLQRLAATRATKIELTYLNQPTSNFPHKTFCTTPFHQRINNAQLIQ